MARLSSLMEGASICLHESSLRRIPGSHSGVRWSQVRHMTFHIPNEPLGGARGIEYCLRKLARSEESFITVGGVRYRSYL